MSERPQSARLPLWFKAKVAELHQLGRKAAARKAWQLVGDTFGDAMVETVQAGEQEVLRLHLPPPHASEAAPDWGRIEGFREDLGLEVRASVEAQESGQLQLLLDFSAAGFDENKAGQ